MAVDLEKDGQAIVAKYRAPDNGPAIVDVRVNKRHVAGSPFTVAVVEGILSASGFRASGQGLLQARTNTVATFTLTHTDASIDDVDTSDFEVYLRHEDGSREGIRFMPRVSLDVGSGDVIQVRYVVDVDAAGTYALHISYMGDALPKGGKRVALNLAMGLALLAATIGAAWSIWSKVKWVGVAAVGLFILLALGGHCYRKLNQKLDRIEDKLGR